MLPNGCTNGCTSWADWVHAEGIEALADRLGDSLNDDERRRLVELLEGWQDD